GVCNVRPTSRGYVQITSPNYDVQPEIQPNYLSTEVDCYVAADAIRLTRAIVGQPPLQALTPEEIQPGANIASDDLESLVDAARDGANSLFHPVGTCRMGSDAHAVVDPRLKVNGVDGLRVVDASIMPSIPSGNPGAPTLMIAEKGAAMILEDWKTS
ncbi:MAG: GMC oxidoreductase, partial [Pseudomonadota bacterium]